MAINKIALDGQTLIDLSTDTVASSNDIVQGKVGHLNDGSVVTGTAQTGGGSSLIVCYLCGANATVTATKGETVVTVTADADGTAYVFVDEIGTYTIASSGKSITKTVSVATVHTMYSVTMSNAETLIQEAKFYTDFDGNYANINSNADYYITPANTPSYHTDVRNYLKMAGNRFSFSSDMNTLLQTQDMTIFAVINLYGSFTNDKGSRVFDFYSSGVEQGVYIYGTNVRGQYSSSYTSVANVELNKWFGLGLRKIGNAQGRNISVYINDVFTNADVTNQATYNITQFGNTQSYAITQGYCAGLLVFDRYLTDAEISDLSAYLVSKE